ncbi:hypothetical protein ACFYNY_36265 [Streptomyces sp. NPDC006530]|uniref:hypothetical protein n=1 Tax=Streptomyces sp. NPDC006530 TaxID=3364750 RepID=UPI0036AC5799
MSHANPSIWPPAEVVTRTRLPARQPRHCRSRRSVDTPLSIGADELRVRYYLRRLGVVL